MYSFTCMMMLISQSGDFQALVDSGVPLGSEHTVSAIRRAILNIPYMISFHSFLSLCETTCHINVECSNRK